MHPCSYSLFTIHMYYCMWYLLKHCPGNNRDTFWRSTACPSALPWPSNHYTLQSPLNFGLHSLSRVEVFIQPFFTLNDDHPHLSALGFVHLQPVLALVTFHTSGASVVLCSVLFAGDYKLQNFSPWPHAVTRKHILLPLKHSLLEVIAGCVIINSVNGTHTVVHSYITGVSLQLELCYVSLCVVRWHLWYKMCWGIKTSLLFCHQKNFFFLILYIVKFELPKLTTWFTHSAARWQMLIFTATANWAKF